MVFGSVAISFRCAFLRGIEAYSVGKLDTSTKIKNNFGFEKYLNTSLVCVISSHRLSIEVGRYARTDTY